MPRGEPTRAITIRLPETLAASIEERAARVGRTLREEVQAVCLGTFRYPGRLYTWAESAERAKLVRQVERLAEEVTDMRAAWHDPRLLLAEVQRYFAGTGALSLDQLQQKISDLLAQ